MAAVTSFEDIFALARQIGREEHADNTSRQATAAIVHYLANDDAPTVPTIIAAGQSRGDSAHEIAREPVPPMLDHAIAAARRGIRVLPIPPNSKAPVLDNWQRLATTDEATIRRWAEEFPGCNWGGISGCTIDFDVKHGKRGAELFELFNALFPETYTQRSASGGYHMLFHLPDGAAPISNANGRMLAKFGRDCGIDVRGAAGQVVLAGSTVDGAPYTVLDDLPIAEAPPDLLALCGAARPENEARDGVSPDHPADIARAVEWLRHGAPPAALGSRGITTYEVACRVRDLGVSEGECLSLVLEHWIGRCDPPLDADDASTLVGNAYRYATGVAGEHSVAAQFGLEAGASEMEDAVAPDALPPGDRPWPEPEDLWADLQPPPRLPAGIFPEVLDRWARDAAFRLGDYDPGCLAVPALVVLSGLAPAGMTVQVKQRDTGYVERPILWGLLHGAPGAKKSPALSLACEPLNKIQAQLDRENAHTQARFSEARASWAKTPKSDRTAPEPTRPRHRAVLVNDVTVEALAPVLADNPNGLACVRDELSGWIGGFDAYRPRGASKDREFWLGAKQGQPFRVIRLSREPVTVPALAVSMLGGIQPDVLRQQYEGIAADGMLQRFLMVHMERTSTDVDRPPDAAALAALMAVAHALHDLSSVEFLEAFRFDAGADAVRQAVKTFADERMGIADLPAGLRGWLDKLEGEWARVALLFHVIEWAASGAANDFPFDPPDPIISTMTARAAGEFLLRYQFPHQLFVHRSAEGTRGEDTDSAWIAGFILAHRIAGISKRDLYTNFRPIRRLKGPAKEERIRRIMGELCSAGWAAPLANFDSRWEVNPNVHVLFAERAAAERQRRGAARESIRAAGAERGAQHSAAEDAE